MAGQSENPDALTVGPRARLCFDRRCFKQRCFDRPYFACRLAAVLHDCQPLFLVPVVTDDDIREDAKARMSILTKLLGSAITRIGPLREPRVGIRVCRTDAVSRRLRGRGMMFTD